MAGFEPAVSRARGVRFSRAKLHPGIGAHDEDRTRLPGSTVRSLRQMGTWAIGALGRDRTDMVFHCPLKTARLPVSPRARMYRLVCNLPRFASEDWRTWSDSNRR